MLNVKIILLFQTCYIEEKTHFGEKFYQSGCKVKHVRIIYTYWYTDFVFPSYYFCFPLDSTITGYKQIPAFYMPFIISLESQCVLSEVPAESRIDWPANRLLTISVCRHLTGSQSNNYMIFLYITPPVYIGPIICKSYSDSTKTTDHITLYYRHKQLADDYAKSVIMT